MEQNYYREEIQVKKVNKLKVGLIVMIIILLSLISFVGIYVQEKNRVNNIIPDYILGMDIEGYRKIELKVNTGTKTINYDENGNVIDSSDTTTTVANSEEQPLNSEEKINEENYKESQKVIEKRLSNIGIEDYIIRKNEKTGNIVVYIPEYENTDIVVYLLQLQGKLEIIDNDTNEVLMTSVDLKKVKAGYGTTSTGSTSIFINMEFNKEGTQKFRDITNKYIETTQMVEVENEETGEKEEKEESVIKKIVLKVDDSTLITTYFDKEVTNGILQLSVGSTSSSSTELQEYLSEANQMAVLLDSGEMPLIYEMTQNKYVYSDIALETILIGIYITIGLVVIAMVYSIIRYKKYGIVVAISLIGYIATLLLVLRYTNVILTLDGLIAIVVSIVLNYILLNMLSRKLAVSAERKVVFLDTMRKYFINIIPIIIVAIVFTVNNWLAIFSFGMVLFWGLVVTAIYQFIITRTLMLEIGNKE